MGSMFYSVDSGNQPDSGVKAPETQIAPRQHGTAALEKALDVLRAVALAARPPNFAELGEQTGLPRSTLHRIVSVLVAQGLVSYGRGERRLVPGLGLLEMARRSFEESDVRAAAHGAIRDLSKSIGETVHLATLVDREVVYLDKVECDHPIRLHSAIGKRGPVHCTAVGKAIAAFLPEANRKDLLSALDFPRFTPRTICSAADMETEFTLIRQRLYSLDREEHAEGVHCCSAPIFDFRGFPIAGISVTAPVSRVSRSEIERIAPKVIAAAREATMRIGGRFAAPGAAPR
jgi:DNA-binding IclR family transcriptional regulator